MAIFSTRRGRTKDWTISLAQADGTDQPLAADDVVRIKIYREGSTTPLLDLSSIADTANGSSITFSGGSNVVQFRLAGADITALSSNSGVYTNCNYDLELAVVDNSELSPEDAIKHACQHILTVLGSGGGEVGDEESSSSSSSSQSSSSSSSSPETADLPA